MPMLGSRSVAVLAGAAVLVGASSFGAVAAGLITSRDIQDDTVASRDIRNNTVRLADINDRAEAALAGKDGEQGPVGPQGPAGEPGAKGEPGDPASDKLGALAVKKASTGMTAIANIGGPYSTNATDLFTFELPEAGTYLVNAYGYFDRINSGADGYEAPSTDTYLQLSLRGPEGLNGGTYFTGPVSKAGFVEATASGAQIVTVAAPTTITVRAFGYNEDRSGFGGTPNSATPQFSAFATVSAVKVG